MINNIITETERHNLLDNMCKLLDEYDYNYSTYALDNIIDEWASNKAGLIEAFKRHPNYVEGKFMIAFNHDYERSFDTKAIRGFSNWIRDYIHLCINDIPSCIKERSENGDNIPYTLLAFLVSLDYHVTERTVTEELAETIKDVIPEVKPHIGERASRLINKICVYLGISKLPNYNREYAKFADGLSPMVIKRHTILSVNPLDYLTMSFGNSWASCHTIDKNNKRNMPDNYSGCYSSGTISYMLDSASMVFYTVDAQYGGDDFWTQPKINRQMFHWGAEKLVQGRLYPQDNDDDNSAYAPYRNIVQQIISTIFDFPNLWTLSRGTEAASRYICSEGTHYKDYAHYSNCTLSKKSGNDNNKCFTVGHAPICIECGSEHDTEENINCCAEGYFCEDCGRRITNEDDVYWVGDRPYCCDCVTYCDRCEEWERNEDATYIECEDRYVCSSCLEDYYTRCDECGEYFPSDDVTYVESAECDVCSNCLEYKFTRCDECGEYFENDDIRYDDDGNALCDECYEEKEKENEEDDEEC